MFDTLSKDKGYNFMFPPSVFVLLSCHLAYKAIMATSSTNTSQSDGASSSLIGNKRGPTRGENVKRLRKQMGGVRLTVEFCEEFRQAIGPNAEKFNNECGIICRKECPFEYVDWRKVPKSVKIMVDVIDFQMGRSFKNHRAKLQEHFTKCHGEEDVERAKGLKPTDSNIKEDAWHKLCDYWSSEKFHAMSVKNTENRGKRKYVSLNGTVSTPNHHFRNRGLSGDSSIGEIETFRKLHCRETEGWVNDYSRTSYEKMVEIKRQNASTENPLGDLEIMQQVLGKRPAYIRGWSRIPSSRSDSSGSRCSTGSSSRLSHTEMSARLASTESDLALTQSELASTKSELVLMKDEMAELRQLVRSLISGQPLPSFSTSQNVQDHGSETRDR